MKQAIWASVTLLLLLCAISPGARAETVPVRVMIGTRQAMVAPSPVFDGKRVLAPLSILNSLGATHKTADSGDKITIIGASGQSGEVEIVNVNGTPMVPMNGVISAIGGDCLWDEESSTLTLIARVQSVEFVDEVLKINCSFPVSCSVRGWTSGNKIIIEIPSAKHVAEAQEVFIGSPVVTRARLGQDGVARIVLDLEKNVPFKILSQPVASQIQIKVSESLPRVRVQVEKPKAPADQPFTVTGVEVRPVRDQQFEVVVHTDGKGNVSTSYGVDPPQIVIKLPGATLADSVDTHNGSHSMLKDLKFSQESHSPAMARLVMNLNRVMVYNVRVEEDAIRVMVRPPDGSGGTLADKFIVIDPGHGGNQNGACSGSVYEKDINLRIAQELASALEAEGARVQLTRNGDVTMGLAVRSEVAINKNADFFISVHCNSNGTQNSASGIETYYHMSEPSPLALAYAVHAGVCSATGMCDRKARSDRSLYNSGLAVLRRLENTGIPGILVECGYINHSDDRSRLTDTKYRKKLADGIVAGLKAYVEGTPIK